jgi:hypothetical protein
MLLGTFLSTSNVTAQVRRPVKTQVELKQSYAEKIEESWFLDADWIDDYDLARQRAAEEKKFIFAYFTRTYAP